jgi:hypothetical protein
MNERMFMEMIHDIMSFDENPHLLLRIGSRGGLVQPEWLQPGLPNKVFQNSCKKLHTVMVGPGKVK